MNLITLDEYKVAKQLSADTKNDVRIGFLIESVSNLIKAYIKANISSEETITETILLDYDTDKIFLDKYPISSVESITETSPRYTTDSTIHVPLTGALDYSVDLVNGIITRIVSEGGFATWPVNPGNVIVEYTNGSAWTSDSVPADLKLAAIIVYLIR